ncbi:hypothetical protein ACIRS1_05340 [Kitasatospora sp. NPDC101176]|uniref:hypothetical protein n=1 Tax=Kitasatospora sp. NPDC101176 TaxID=3364099 RepID=UPI0037FD4219
MDFIYEAPSGAVYDQYFTFDITSQEERRGLLSFPNDQLVFAFRGKPNTPATVCKVELTNEIGNQLLNGTATVRVEENQVRTGYLTFRGFGWHDEARRNPITRCGYRVSLDESDATIEVRVFGLALDPPYSMYYGAPEL